MAVCGVLAPAVCGGVFTDCTLGCDPPFAAADAFTGVDPLFTLCTFGCDPVLFACELFAEAGCDPVLFACEPFDEAGCDPVLALDDTLPAFAGVGEGEVLACGAGDFAGVGVPFAGFWAGAGLAVGLGFNCWPELPAPAFCAAAVAARTIANATT